MYSSLQDKGEFEKQDHHISSFLTFDDNLNH
jgi:hypothetical protein